MDIKGVILWTKFLTGKLKVADGSLCEFSKRFWDLHDYPRSKGGDGIPDHYTTYECPYCKKLFTI
jgi:hypothetical protein